MSFDLGASSGSYNGYSYSEITLGLNYYLLPWLAWRNAPFYRSGGNQDSTGGLDSSIRLIYSPTAAPDEISMTFFGGPGYRFSAERYSGAFVEAGALFRMDGVILGAGAKSLTYSNPGTQSDGTNSSKSDTVVFIILGGGGSF